MALSKPSIASLFILSLLLYVVRADTQEADTSNTVAQTLAVNIDCGSACNARCAKASRKKICKRACGTCCSRCSCVPPGTSGNAAVCPCYANMTTHGGRRKCP